MPDMKIGFPGRVLEIPYPSSGMAFTNNNDTEETELYSGQRHIWNAPTSYKSFNMSWRNVTPRLQPLMDLYNRRWGNKPFYLQDPLNTEGNLLPPRWAYSWQLAYIANGQGQPIVNDGGLFPGEMVAVFNDKGWFTNPSVKIMTVLGKPLYLRAWGSAINGAGVMWRKHTPGTGWSGYTLSTTVQGIDTTVPTTILTAAESQTVDFVELTLYVPTTGVLQLFHMDVSTTDYRSAPDPRRPGQGVGALRFASVLDGELVSKITQRIGLSVDLTEVEHLSV